jgi:hypothetical protein
MKIFLVGKHWLIFTLIVGPSLVFRIFCASLNLGADFYFRYSPIVAGSTVLLLFLWLWTIVKASVGMKTLFKRYRYSVFNVSILLIVIHVTTILTLIKLGFNVFFNNAFLPFNVIFCLAAMYALGFSARVIKSIELNRPAHLDEYIGYFFSFVFFPNWDMDNSAKDKRDFYFRSEEG